jgi:hypothetical protein
MVMTAHLHKQRLVTYRPYTNAVSAQLHETEGVLDVWHFRGWPTARGNSDRVALPIVFQPDFFFETVRRRSEPHTDIHPIP